MRSSFYKVTIYISFFITSLLINENLLSQSTSLPSFKLDQANGTVFNSQRIVAGKPVLMVYFSPECDHCIVFMKDFFKRANEFKKLTVLFITYLPLDRVVKFASDYNILKYPNITLGTEGMKFIVRNHYGIQNMPYAVVYNKDRKFIAKYEREIPIDDILNKLK